MDEQELRKVVENNFNTGQRRANKRGLKGPRYTIRIISQRWNKPFSVIVEQIARCTLILITVF